MSLKDQITQDMKSAMKAGEKDRLKVVRLIRAAIKQVEIDKRTQLDDAAVLGRVRITEHDLLYLAVFFEQAPVDGVIEQCRHDRLDMGEVVDGLEQR